MNKVRITPQPVICTTPAVLVGSVVDDKQNFMTVAWCGVVNSTPPMLSVSIRPHRYTLQGIVETKEFSVNVPSVAQVKEADYCGIVSGAKEDKNEVCGFKVFYGNLKTAPLIEQCPVNLACKVEQITLLGSHYLVIGRIEETYVSENCLTDKLLDIRKVQPFLYATAGTSEYFAYGESLGKAFVLGKGLAGK
jgi:flavin reductase (DIM6/NTAB) family NADH-FMN oxidoreductase RutF